MEIKSGTDLHRAIQLALGRSPYARIFRNEVGEAWVGKAVVHGSGPGMYVTITYPRRVRFGLATGASDLIGLTSVKITADMVGQTLAVFTAIEGKYGEDTPTDEQENFIAMVQGLGGFAGIATSVADAFAIARPRV